jgi:hypothetical protein
MAIDGALLRWTDLGVPVKQFWMTGGVKGLGPWPSLFLISSRLSVSSV